MKNSTILIAVSSVLHITCIMGLPFSIIELKFVTCSTFVIFLIVIALMAYRIKSDNVETALQKKENLILRKIAGVYGPNQNSVNELLGILKNDNIKGCEMVFKDKIIEIIHFNAEKCRENKSDSRIRDYFHAETNDLVTSNSQKLPSDKLLILKEVFKTTIIKTLGISVYQNYEKILE